jgi:hypothetical protein
MKFGVIDFVHDRKHRVDIAEVQPDKLILDLTKRQQARFDSIIVGDGDKIHGFM